MSYFDRMHAEAAEGGHPGLWRLAQYELGVLPLRHPGEPMRHYSSRVAGMLRRIVAEDEERDDRETAAIVAANMEALT